MVILNLPANASQTYTTSGEPCPFCGGCQQGLTIDDEPICLACEGDEENDS